MAANYEYQPSFVLGFHGCDESVAEKIFSGDEPHLIPSEKKHDWLGSGIYFWEGNLARARAWAHARCLKGAIAKPAVVGAVIDLGFCLDLFDSDGINQVAAAHEALQTLMLQAGTAMPENRGKTPDNAARYLDCMVMNYLHSSREAEKRTPYASVRGPFLEGEAIYHGAGFRRENHIQICVRHTAQIKGYFRPIGS